jgi:hypothetical protein
VSCFSFFLNCLRGGGAPLFIYFIYFCHAYAVFFQFFFPLCNLIPKPHALALPLNHVPLNALCGDPKNVVFVVTGRPCIELAECFFPCQKLGLVVDRSFFYK